jgi:hypothetical protein
VDRSPAEAEAGDEKKGDAKAAKKAAAAG